MSAEYEKDMATTLFSYKKKTIVVCFPALPEYSYFSTGFGYIRIEANIETKQSAIFTLPSGLKKGSLRTALIQSLLSLGRREPITTMLWLTHTIHCVLQK